MQSSSIPANGIEIACTRVGAGPALVLLHGWPHTSALWREVRPTFAEHFSTITPDLRGTGGSTRARDGYDAGTIADDLVGLLDALGVAEAAVVALDASVPAAFLAATTHPDRITRLVLAESLLPSLPGGEAFLVDGPPWWFGFHAVPGLAERVVAGHEAEYLGWFLRNGTHDGRGIAREIEDEFVTAYAGEESLRCGFSYYRVLAENAALVHKATSPGRLTVPTLALGGDAVGDALSRQLSHVCDDLRSVTWPDVGHLLPLDAPERFITEVMEFLG